MGTFHMSSEGTLCMIAEGTVRMSAEGTVRMSAEGTQVSPLQVLFVVCIRNDAHCKCY